MPMNISAPLQNCAPDPAIATPSSPATAAPTQQLEPAVSSSNVGTPRVPCQHPQSDTSLVNAQASASTPRATLYFRLTDEEASRLKQSEDSGGGVAWRKAVKELHANCRAPGQSSDERFVTEQQPTGNFLAGKSFLYVKPDSTLGILSGKKPVLVTFEQLDSSAPPTVFSATR